jgi:hypothetical protein
MPIAVLAVKHRLVQPYLSSVVGGSNVLDPQKRPEGILLFAQLMACAHSLGP